MKFAPKGHPQIKRRKVGVLIINLGTPDATDYFSMRRYLKEFLSDSRVIEAPRLLWWFILNFIILTKRPSASGEAYKSIWNKEKDESPLKTITRSQAQKIARDFSDYDDVVIEWGMRYGNPSTKAGIESLQAQGCDRILLFPLYPQYAAATTATACDKAFDALKEMRWQPTIRVVPPYFEDPDYIEALADSIQDHIAEMEWTPDLVIASFHGLPQRYFDAGDPYHCQCAKTTRLLRERLGWPEEKLKLTFQSRFGKEEWLQPYTDETVEKLAKDGVKNLAIVCPGFSADCVETLEEIAMEAGEIFEENGGENFTLIPCLNDSQDSIRVLSGLIKNELRGWVRD
ncbi:MAG: ferrochelatase [Rhizobiales bacterium]|nr:ferrochelatase [Hyphomicrobiales bacterium]